MAEDQTNSSAEPNDAHSPNRSLTLEQALLAPLDSILKAQLHSARSFLNMLLQLGYPHNEEEGNSPPVKPDNNQGAGSNSQLPAEKKTPDEPYHLEFAFTDEDNNKQLLRVPALSLVPISPLAVDSANFELEMAADEVVSRTQIRSSSGIDDKDDNSKEKTFSAKKRPWFLVEEPLDIRGEIIAPTKSDESSKKQTQSSIKINIQVKSIPMPAGLNKLLTTLTAMSEIQDVDKPAPDQQENAQNNES